MIQMKKEQEEKGINGTDVIEAQDSYYHQLTHISHSTVEVNLHYKAYRNVSEVLFE